MELHRIIGTKQWCHCVYAPGSSLLHCSKGNAAMHNLKPFTAGWIWLVQFSLDSLINPWVEYKWSQRPRAMATFSNE